MNKHKKIYIILLLIGSIFLFISLIPMIYEAELADKLPTDRSMIWGEHVYTYDYNVYLSKIRQGQEGRFLTVDKYDNNPLARGVALQMLYLWGGKLTAPFGISPPFVYHSLRLILSLTWIATLSILCMRFFKTKRERILGLLLSILSASFPVFYQLDGTTWWGMYMSWWQEMDLVKRISYLPHYLANYTILGILTLLMVDYHKTKNRRLFYSITVLLFVSFFIHPAGGLTFLGSWVLYHILLLSFQLQNKLNKIQNTKYKIQNAIRDTLLLFFVSLVPLIYIKSVTSSYPWRSLVDFDTTHPLPFVFTEYLLSLGPVVLTGALGIALVFLKKDKIFLGLATWVLSALGGLVIFSFFPIQSPVRFVQTANHVPLALLSVYAATTIITKINIKLVAAIFYTFLTLIMAIGLIQGYFSIKAQMHFIRQRAFATQPAVPYPSQVMYPLKDFYYALLWLRLYSNYDDVVLSKITAGNYIPAYAGNFVYLGHNPETPHFEEREEEINKFFTYTWDEKTAREFLKKRNITYVFYGPQEKEATGAAPPPYDFLKPVYSSFHVTIHRVR